MRKILTAATAALTFAGALAATTAPVQAQTRGHGGGGFHGAAVRGGGFRGGGYRGYHGGYGYRGGYGGYGLGAGLAGLAIGAALASPYYGYGYGPYYDYGPGYYGYGDGCAQRVWDPYWGRWTVRYAC